MKIAQVRRVRVVVAALLAVCGIGAAPAGGAASITAHEASCAGFTGPAWAFPEFSKTGTHWKVTAQRVGCAFATRWSKKLLKTKYSGEAATKLHGPKGWACLPSIPHGGGVPGSCRQGRKLFAWGPDVHL